MRKKTSPSGSFAPKFSEPFLFFSEIHFRTLPQHARLGHNTTCSRRRLQRNESQLPNFHTQSFRLLFFAFFSGELFSVSSLRWRLRFSSLAVRWSSAVTLVTHWEKINSVLRLRQKKNFWKFSKSVGETAEVKKAICSPNRQWHLGYEFAKKNVHADLSKSRKLFKHCRKIIDFLKSGYPIENNLKPRTIRCHPRSRSISKKFGSAQWSATKCLPMPGPLTTKPLWIWRIPQPLCGHRGWQTAEEVVLPMQGLPREDPGVPTEAKGRQRQGCIRKMTTSLTNQASTFANLRPTWKQSCER